MKIDFGMNNNRFEGEPEENFLGLHRFEKVFTHIPFVVSTHRAYYVLCARSYVQRTKGKRILYESDKNVAKSNTLGRLRTNGI